MKQKNKSIRSLYTEWFMLLIISAIIAIIFFLGLYSISEVCIEKHFEKTGIIKQKNDDYADKLNKYVKEKKIATSDIEKLEKWVMNEKIVMIQVYKENYLIYDSEYGAEYIPAVINEYYSDNFYNIDFVDGTAIVAISGVYSYKVYTIALITQIILSFMLFLIISVLGIRIKIKYIQKLSEEIEILESGNLDYKITTKGRDEITELANGLNAMRESFKKQIEQEEYLMATNQSMVTEISHDMRTPLTSIMLYAEILQARKYKNEEQMNEYIDKILKKTIHLKNLSDHLFDYSLCARESKVILESPEDVKTVFYDQLSEVCGYLEEQGYMVETKFTWEKVKVKTNTEYISRIFDNITSNIIKYANLNRPIIIRSMYDKEYFSLIFENYLGFENENKDSNNIGIHNIKNMMISMNGDCEYSNKNNKYTISIIFKII